MSAPNADSGGSSAAKQRHNIFLSHNTADKPAVEEIGRRLAEQEIQVWGGQMASYSGRPWQPAIEKALAESETCAVFVGPSGLDAWQNEEMRAAIDGRVSDTEARFRVIPVLLPGAKRAERSSLPTFLAARPGSNFMTRSMTGMPSTGWFAASAVLNPVPVPAEPYMKASVHIVGCAFLMSEMLPFSSGAKL